MRTEDEFGITISDDEGVAVITVGDLYNLVPANKIDVTPGCLDQQAFYLTRRALVETLDIPVVPSDHRTRLSPLLPNETRQSAMAANPRVHRFAHSATGYRSAEADLYIVASFSQPQLQPCYALSRIDGVPGGARDCPSGCCLDRSRGDRVAIVRASFTKDSH